MQVYIVKIIAVIGGASPILADASNMFDLSILGPSASTVACVILFLRYMTAADQRQRETDLERDKALAAVLGDLKTTIDHLIVADEHHIKADQVQQSQIEKLAGTLDGVVNLLEERKSR